MLLKSLEIIGSLYCLFLFALKNQDGTPTQSDIISVPKSTTSCKKKSTGYCCGAVRSLPTSLDQGRRVSLEKVTNIAVSGLEAGHETR